MIRNCAPPLHLNLTSCYKQLRLILDAHLWGNRESFFRGLQLTLNIGSSGDKNCDNDRFSFDWTWSQLIFCLWATSYLHKEIKRLWIPKSIGFNPGHEWLRIHNKNVAKNDSHKLKPIHCMKRTTPDPIIQDELHQSHVVVFSSRPTIYFEVHLP